MLTTTAQMSVFVAFVSFRKKLVLGEGRTVPHSRPPPDKGKMDLTDLLGKVE